MKDHKQTPQTDEIDVTAPADDTEAPETQSDENTSAENEPAESAEPEAEPAEPEAEPDEPEAEPAEPEAEPAEPEAESDEPEAEPDEPEGAPAPKKKGGIKGFFGAIGRFFKKHKVLGVLLVVLILIFALVLRGCAAVAAAAQSLSQYSFVRTTTLTRGDLTSSVSTTGTVESANTSTVTYSAGTTSLPKFTAVNVAVGDTVQAGDVIATLDTTDIEKSIAKEQENINEQVTKAKTTYDRAVTAYNDAVAKYNKEKATSDDLLNTVLDLRKQIQALSGGGAAGTDTATPLADYTAASSDLAMALNDTALQAALSEAHFTLNVMSIPTSSTDTAGYNNIQTALAAAQSAADLNASTTLDAAAVSAAISNIQILLEKQKTTLATYEAAVAAEQAASAAAQANSSKLASLQQDEAQYDTQYESSLTQLESLQSQITQAKQTMDDAKTALNSASDSDTLDNLKDQLEACSLTAATAGKVTSLNASVGSTPSGTIATIQDVDDLKVSVTISESDINTIETGMACQITTDATEGTIHGTLTQIDPVAGENGSFGAEVTVTDTGTSLKIGMNATVKIILSNTSDCFTVPIDAVGSDDDGKGDYVYRKTGGEGTEMTFDKVYVTTGDSNDYYIEIDSADLAEGDVIRSSADLTQGIVTTDAASDPMMQMDVAYEEDDAPIDEGQGGGNRPSGGMGGGAPAGGQ